MHAWVSIETIHRLVGQRSDLTFAHVEFMDCPDSTLRITYTCCCTNCSISKQTIQTSSQNLHNTWTARASACSYNGNQPTLCCWSLRASGRRKLLSMVRGARINLRRTRDGPSVGSSCHDMGLFSSELHRALRYVSKAKKRQLTAYVSITILFFKRDLTVDVCWRWWPFSIAVERPSPPLAPSGSAPISSSWGRLAGGRPCPWPWMKRRSRLRLFSVTCQWVWPQGRRTESGRLMPTRKVMT